MEREIKPKKKIRRPVTKNNLATENVTKRRVARLRTIIIASGIFCLKLRKTTVVNKKKTPFFIVLFYFSWYRNFRAAKVALFNVVIINVS